jgi:DNA repair exonuclease SbcCD ATPase subunit
MLTALTLSAGACLGQSESQRTDSLFDALQTQVATLQRQVADLSKPDETMKDLQTQVGDLQSEQQNLSSAQQGLGEQFKQLKDNVNKVDKDGRKGRSSLGSRLKSLQDGLAKGDSTLRALSSSLDEVDVELDQADSAIKMQDSTLMATISKVDNESASRMEADSSAKNLTMLGYLLAILVGVIAHILGKKAAVAVADSTKSDLSDDIRRARTEMDAGILKVDQKLMESLSKMSSEAPEVSGEGKEPDHGLAIKVADEINRMENNLSRMDPTVKGHKHLTKSIKHIRTNMKANGYELVALLGKPYDPGMKAEAEIITDDSLQEGEFIITRVSRPEIRYEGEVIQISQIQVSQGA